MNRSTFSKALQQPVSKASSANTSAGLRNLHQLIQLRWIAVVGQLLTIQATHYSLGLPLPLQAMLSIVAGMVVFNIASLLRWRTRRGVHDVELFIGLLIDVAALTAQLYLSGGIGNPFVFLYLLQIAVGAMLLRGGYIWSIVVVASACVVLLAQHSQPLPLATNVRDGWASPYVLGLLVCFMLNAILVVVFITRISHNLPGHPVDGIPSFAHRIGRAEDPDLTHDHGADHSDDGGPGAWRRELLGWDVVKLAHDG